MSGRVLLHRPARVHPPAIPTDPLTVAAPPAVPNEGMSLPWYNLLWPLVASLGSVFFVLYNPKPLFIALAVVMGLLSISLGLGGYLHSRRAGGRRAKLNSGRYDSYLQRVQQAAGEIADRQRAAAAWTHPVLERLLTIARHRTRVWERRLGDWDWLVVRIGTGTVPLAAPILIDDGGDPLTERDAELMARAETIVARRKEVAIQPMVVDLRSKPSMSVVGDGATGRRVVRRALCEAATFCAPEDLRVAVFCPPELRQEWEWVKWLPHTIDPDDTDGIARLLTGDAAELADMVGGDLSLRRKIAGGERGGLEQMSTEIVPHLLVVVDGFRPGTAVARLPILSELASHGRELSASLVTLVRTQSEEPTHVDIRVDVGDDGSVALEDVHDGVADDAPLVLCTAIAKTLAPLRLTEPTAKKALSETCRLFELLGLGAVESVDPATSWQPRAEGEVLRVPIGVNVDGQPTYLDFKESALGGMGPHGLVVGATGSGKSELLRTVVTGLAATHPPEQLSFVLVDFKGGAAFAELAELPHVAGMITNLADDLSMIDRMHEALFGEQQRRQRLLRQAGNLDTAREYQRRRAAGVLPGSEPLPCLVIVVDEFGELLANRPDFIDLFVAIGRVGRSLGMHLLLASQRLEEGRLRGLDSHLSYRICLRTFSPVESRVAIGTPDAYYLPPIPGSAYLKVDTSIYERFKAARVSGSAVSFDAPMPERPTVTVFDGRRDTSKSDVRAGTVIPASGEAAESSQAGQPVAEESSEMAMAVERLRSPEVRPAHKVWLPPLPVSLTLGDVLPSLQRDRLRGLQCASWPGCGALMVPLGLADRPSEQAQVPFVLDFAGADGHLAVVGAPQSGKSTLLRSLVTALVCTHTPSEVQVYGIDFGGGSLHGLAGSPHVGEVCGRLDGEKVRRVVSDVWSLIDEREGQLRRLGIDSMATFRLRRRQGEVIDDPYGDVFLVIDGWAGMRAEHEDLEPLVVDIAGRGLGSGLHLVLTANRWLELRANLRDNIAGRLELHLNEPSESDLDRKAAAAIPAGVPGRGLVAGGFHLQVARPVMGDLDTEAVAAASSAAWPGVTAPRVKVLPSEVRLADLLEADGGSGVPIGVEEEELSAVSVDSTGADPHFLVFGDSESGKTTFLRSWLSGLIHSKYPSQAMILAVDYRRSLLDAIPADYLWGYGGAAPSAASLVSELAEGIAERLPPPTLPPAAIAQRSWWEGPEFYVVVDDYDLVAGSSGNPLLPLVDLLAQGRDLGLHVILARRVGGMSRAGFEPLLSRLRELTAPGLILSGDSQEGALIGGVRASAQPPGRGILVRRKRRPVRVQVAMPPPSPGTLTRVSAEGP